MNNPFKKRILNASVVPHSSEPTRSMKVFAVIIPVALLILLTVSVYLTVLTMLNFRNLKKFSSVRKTKEDISLLTMKEKEIGGKIENIEKNIDSLKSIAKEITPVYKFLSGMNIDTKESAIIPDNTDSLLLLTEYMRSLSDSAMTMLSNGYYASKVPSVVPVNGWVIRDYGKVADPYTETEKFSPGIVFVSGNNEKVYAAADGYVSFAGSRKKLGNCIVIDHGDYETTYAHLSRFSVSAGKKVKKGDVIGYLGSTGRTISPALYYEIAKSGEKIDPNNSFMIPTYMFYDTLLKNL